MRIIPTAPLTILVLIAACAEFPELDDKISQGAAEKPYPKLIPVESVRIDNPDPRITPDTGDDLQARVAALKRRADALRGPVIDPATRRRMQAGVSR